MYQLSRRETWILKKRIWKPKNEIKFARFFQTALTSQNELNNDHFRRFTRRHLIMTFTCSEHSCLGAFRSNMGEKILPRPSPNTSLKRSFGSSHEQVCTKGRDVINTSLWLVLTRNSWFTKNNCKLHHQTDQNKCTKKTINTQLIKTNVWKRKDHYEKALLETRHMKWRKRLNYMPPEIKPKRRKRKRPVTWFNPP